MSHFSFCSSSFCRLCFSSHTFWRNVEAVRVKGARTLNSWQWRMVSLISATISSLFILLIFIFSTVIFFPSYFLWYVNIVTVYYYLWSLYLPPLSTVVYDCSRRDCEHVCMWAHAIKVCKTHYQFSFISSAICCVFHLRNLNKQTKKNKKEKRNMLRSALGTSSHVSWNIILSEGGKFTINVRQASIADLTTVVSINGLLLSVLLLHCVDFVIWNKCLFSFCMFFTMLKVAATTVIIIVP